MDKMKLGALAGAVDVLRYLLDDEATKADLLDGAGANGIDVSALDDRLTELSIELTARLDAEAKVDAEQ